MGNGGGNIQTAGRKRLGKIYCSSIIERTAERILYTNGKDEYMFDFAELSPEYSEHQLEMQLVNNIRAFLIEMGGDFSFIGNQYHLVAGSKDIYINMLLFHRRLRSLIAIELKIGEFEAEYALKRANAPIGVAAYQLHNTLPDEMKAMLPEPEEIARRLKIFDD